MQLADKPPDDPPIAPVEAGGSTPDLPGKPSGSDLGAQAPTVDSETEIQLLQRAQDALAGSPATALDLINRHIARFPNAGLGQEREVIAVDALVRLGRIGEARSGPHFCNAATQYCERVISDVSNWPDDYFCPQLPAACAGAPSCGCVVQDPCGQCTTTSDGGLMVVCPGG